MHSHFPPMPSGPPAGPAFHPMVGARVASHAGRLHLADAIGLGVGAAIPLLLGLTGVAGCIEHILEEKELLLSEIAMTVLLVVVGASLVWLAIRRAIRKSKQTLDVHQGGLIWRIGSDERVIAWPSIKAARWVRLIATNGQVKGHRLCVTLNDGKKLTFDDWLRDLPSLQAYLAQFVRFV